VRNGSLAYSWGDITRSEDLASAAKPVISTLLLFAVHEGHLKGVDERVSELEPRLRELNGGKDAEMTWRHLASQTSGYGLTDRPGEAYAYNDFALALYFQTLTEKVFRASGTEVLRTRLADRLQFQDQFEFNALGPDRPGRLRLSLRDFVRFGLLWLRDGRWRNQAVLPRELIHSALEKPLDAQTRLTAARDAEMLPGQRSMGGGKNITPVGPGFYSFNWWLNATDREGRRMSVAMPPDAFVASGHGGQKTLWIIPSLDLIVAWHTNNIRDHNDSPGRSDTRWSQAAKLIVEAATN
jgi:CubicO group peptidase (beta-lactamase class C family)